MKRTDSKFACWQFIGRAGRCAVYKSNPPAKTPVEISRRKLK